MNNTFLSTNNFKSSLNILAVNDNLKKLFLFCVNDDYKEVLDLIKHIDFQTPKQSKSENISFFIYSITHLKNYHLYLDEIIKSVSEDILFNFIDSIDSQKLSLNIFSNEELKKKNLNNKKDLQYITTTILIYLNEKYDLKNYLTNINLLHANINKNFLFLKENPDLINLELKNIANEIEKDIIKISKYQIKSNFFKNVNGVANNTIKDIFSQNFFNFKVFKHFSSSSIELYKKNINNNVLLNYNILPNTLNTSNLNNIVDNIEEKNIVKHYFNRRKDFFSFFKNINYLPDKKEIGLAKNEKNAFNAALIYNILDSSDDFDDINLNLMLKKSFDLAVMFSHINKEKLEKHYLELVAVNQGNKIKEQKNNFKL